METAMHTTPLEQSANHPLDRDLGDLVRLLAGEVRAARVEASRQRRRVSILIGFLVVLVTGAGWAILPARSVAQGGMPAQAHAATLGADERAARRADLVAMLPADKRRDLEQFEQEVSWLSGYMRTWDEGQAAARWALSQRILW
jgi:hypothetical protein